MNAKYFYPRILLSGMLVIVAMLAFIHPASASHRAVTILAMPGETAGMTRSLAKVYLEPDDASSLLNVLPPESKVSLLGLDESGAWFGVGAENGAALSGWISRSDVKQSLMSARSYGFTRVFGQPSSSSTVVYGLAPAQEVKAIGHSLDDGWIAVTYFYAGKSSIGWVMASDLVLPDVVAATIPVSYTAFYEKPDASSKVMSSLDPYQEEIQGFKVILIERNQDGTWFAALNAQRKFIGWVQAGDLSGAKNWALLPVSSDK